MPVSKKTIQILERYQTEKVLNLVKRRSQTFERTAGLWNFAITQAKIDYKNKTKQELKTEYLDGVLSEETSEKESRFFKIVRKIRSKPWAVTSFLVITMLLYMLIGTFIFYAIEIRHADKKHSDQHKIVLDEALKTTKHLLLFVEEYCFTNASTFIDCKKNLSEAFLTYEYDRNKELLIKTPYSWGFASSLFYCFSIVTTIGYGNIVCETWTGKFVTMIYAIIGVPLVLMSLNMTGKLALGWLQKLRLVSKRYLGKTSFGKRFKIDNNETDSNDESLISATLVLVVVCIFLFAGVFLAWEEWDYFTSLYFTFITLSTIGFGDVVPANAKTATAGYIFMFLGLAFFSMFLNIAGNRLENNYLSAMHLLEESFNFAETNYEPPERETSN